jgi:hypothetical protein
MDEDRSQEEANSRVEEDGLMTRRDLFVALKKWSTVVAAGAVLGGAVLGTARQADAGAWVNSRGGGGGSWVNRGGGGWVNRRGGGGWINRR